MNLMQTGAPLRSNGQVEFPIRATFWPMGAAVCLETDSIDVYRTAAGLWSAYPPGELTPPARLRVAVRAGGRQPECFGPIGFYQFPENGAGDDLDAGTAYATITPSLARDEKALTYELLEPLTYTLLNCLHFLPIHAACVSLAKKAAILCGDSGTGKTSMAYAFALRGWDYLSGDATHLLRNSEHLRVFGRPYEIRFRGNAGQIFPELSAFPITRRPNGKLDYEIDTRKLPIRLARSAESCCVVSLDRQCGSKKTILEPIDSSSLMESLSEPIRYGGSRTRSEQTRALHRLLGVPAYRLTYGEFDRAEALLRAELEGVRDATQSAAGN